MYIPNLDKYKNPHFWFGFLKVALPVIIMLGILLALLNNVS